MNVSDQRMNSMDALPVNVAASSNPLVAKIVAFLHEIGLKVQTCELTTPCFLPGIQIREGGLLVDEEKLLYPGDLLHEAGHLAVKTEATRARAGFDAGKKLGDEIAAIIWSYAALTHLGLDPAVVFHPHGYKGASQNFIDNFTRGFHPGLPLLQWMGLTFDEKNAHEQGVPPFPHMIRWLRE